MSDTLVVAGVCPEHNAIWGDDVEFNFPAEAECNICGHTLDTAGVVARSLVEESDSDEEPDGMISANPGP